MTNRPLVVQASFPAPRPTTNPYIVMLADALRATPGVQLRLFSWRSALFARYDVFHLHWPDILVRGHGRGKTAVRRILTALLLARLAITRTPIVRTAHNLAAHEQQPLFARVLLDAFDRRTALWIALNPETILPEGPQSVVILHGSYTSWYAQHPKPAPVPGRLAYFGLIRPYKNVEGLLRAFAGLPDPELTLEVAGNPSAELRAPIDALAAADPRTRAQLRFVPDADVARVVGEAELVVLPYREMHNSGGLLLALSLDRPVLVPATPANARLADEVGAGWVHLYSGDLTAAALAEALRAVRATATTRGERPDLSAREWADAGIRHLAAYRRAIAGRTGRRHP
ncbi:MAG: hypothetical protein JWP66_1889 [Naasia sp.]|nr:hypothetical protein [Naasia sp.]